MKYQRRDYIVARIITFAMQKGGCSKSTSAGITAFLLCKEGFRVLLVDTDSQGNCTELVTNCEVGEFETTTLEAMQTGDARPHIRVAENGVHVLPSNFMMATFDRWLYREYEREGKDPNKALEIALKTVEDMYDYILIDTPPALGSATINAFSASDDIVAMFEPSRFCYAALPDFFDFLKLIQERTNPRLKFAGILRTLTDPRRSDVKSYNKRVQGEYESSVFETIIKRSAATGRVGIDGLTAQNPELKAAVEPYIPFVKELLERCPVSMKIN
jgi:chromosome partitioning protein